VDLGGVWKATVADDALRRAFPNPDFADGGWEQVTVPGHWRTSPAFAASDGSLLYRRRFEFASQQARGNESTDDGAAEIRHWLDLDGIFYLGDVWLDGSYLGATEGYFVRHSFEVTEQLAARVEHVLAVEVACPPEDDLKARHNLTGAFQRWAPIDQAWNPGGIWAPVRLTHSGPVRIRALAVTCPDASTERATLQFEALLDTADAVGATLETTVRTGGEPVAQSVREQALAVGANRVRWRQRVEQPSLWWPRHLGDQTLHQVEVAVRIDGRCSDRREVRTGLRQVRMRDFSLTVNGERIFAKGTNLGPTSRALADASDEAVAGDVRAAAEANLDLVRVHAHVSRPPLYDMADELGMLVWQDLPLRGTYEGVRRQAVRQARAAVNLLAHHPSVAIWCGHEDPFDHDVLADPPGRPARALPGWNRARLDGSVRRALERADGSRPVVAHSGVLPHPVGGTDTHEFCGWDRGELRDLPGRLARFPVLARWIGEFGAQAVPDSDDFIDTTNWPKLDWEHLRDAHGLQKSVFDRRVPPADYASFTWWRQATQQHQAEVIRYHVETLRRLKYRPAGGFCQFLLADSQPAISWSVLDHRRRPKAGFTALRDACAPVVVIADWPAPTYHPGERVRLDVHVVSDRRRRLENVRVGAGMRWPGGEREWVFRGDVPADSCTRVGRLDAVIPPEAVAGRLLVRLCLSAPDEPPSSTSYTSAVEEHPRPEFGS
jgi:beta-mannosidase